MMLFLVVKLLMCVRGRLFIKIVVDLVMIGFVFVGGGLLYM